MYYCYLVKELSIIWEDVFFVIKVEGLYFFVVVVLIIVCYKFV